MRIAVFTVSVLAALALAACGGDLSGLHGRAADLAAGRPLRCAPRLNLNLGPR